MAKGLITAELTGLTELIATLEAMPEIADQAIKAGAEAMMQQGVIDVRNSYYSVGGKQGDYIDRSIGNYGTPNPSGGSANLAYWTSVGVFKIDSIYNEYDQLKKSKQKSSIKKDALTAAQVAYWIENGTSRLRSGARKPKNFVDAAFSSEELITVTPKPFISNAFVTGWNRQFDAFKIAFDNKVKELT